LLLCLLIGHGSETELLGDGKHFPAISPTAGAAEFNRVLEKSVTKKVHTVSGVVEISTIFALEVQAILKELNHGMTSLFEFNPAIRPQNTIIHISNVSFDSQDLFYESIQRREIVIREILGSQVPYGNPDAQIRTPARNQKSVFQIPGEPMGP
jgi:hypothetical protein